MTDELIGPTSPWFEPCYVRLGTMDGAGALVRRGESAS